jgi:CubicO group peptidase (beta-lactamase class C family)
VLAAAALLAQEPSVDLDAFARELDALRVAARIPGMSVAVVRGGRVVFARGFGEADVERHVAASPGTAYDIASVSKPISAVVALKMVEDRRLDLDRPLIEYSEWSAFCQAFGAQPSIFARGLQCDPPVHTLRHLLTHTAVGAPGTRFSYNPPLYSWASRPIMAASGRQFSDLVAQYIFEPAGMSGSARVYRDRPVPPSIGTVLAPPHQVNASGQAILSPPLGPQGDGAAGGVVSTVLDLARFDIALDDGRLISPESVRAMMTPARTPSGEPLPYALGWFVEDYGGRALVWHSGWWEQAYSALYLKVPEVRATLIVLANSEGVWWHNPLDRAEVVKSPFAQLFLRTFVAGSAKPH